MKFLLFIIKSVLAVAISFALFAAVPVIYSRIGLGLAKSEETAAQAPLLMNVQTKKSERKNTPLFKPRQIAQASGSRAGTRSFDLKFSPDLKIGSGEGVAIEEKNLENIVFEEGEADINAVAVSKMPIPYPPRAKEEGIEGVVEMILLIDRKGIVSNIDFVKVPHALFKKPIEKVVKEWKFKPAMNKGIPVNMRVRQVIEFNLEK